MSYFDWAATSLPNKDILQESLDVSLAFSANPSGVHDKSIASKKKLEEARKRCADALSVKEGSIIFTSGGTESNYLPMLSLLQRQASGSILVSAIEHSAVKEQAIAMERCGLKVINVSCDKDGIVKPEHVIQKLQDDTLLVCIMAVNNETGAVQPIEEIADAITEHCKGKKRPKLHVDAVQAIGKVPFNLAHPGIDTAAISAHKLCGPRGSGILYMKDRQEPFLRGGGQEGGLRSGTENLFGIWALMRCLEEYAQKEKLARHIEKQSTLMSDFIAKLADIKTCGIIPENRVNESQNYSSWVIQASFDKIPGEVMVRSLSQKGFYISTGSACSSRKVNRPVLAAMGIGKDVATNTVRFSFGVETTKVEVDALLEAVKDICAMFG